MIPNTNSVSQNTEIDNKQRNIENFKCIPEDFKQFKNFVVWKSVPDPERPKPLKIPLNPLTSGPSGHAEGNKDTWSDYDAAMGAYARYKQLSGIGFVLNPDTMRKNLVAIDLDHVLDPATGEIVEWAQKILDTFADSYQEVSFSGDGFHIFIYADWPDGDNEFSHKGTTIEIYRGKRYIAITGNIHNGRDKITSYGNEVVELIAEYFPPRIRKKRPAYADEYCLDYDRIMVMLKKDQRAWRLFKGEIPDDTSYRHENGDIDKSCVDFALACAIAYFTRDEDVIEKVMRESGLLRGKWDSHPTYLREFTIAKAVDACEDFYIPLTARIERAKNTVSNLPELTTETVFTDAVMESLAILKRHVPIEFVKFEERFKKAKLGIRGLHAAIGAVKLPRAATIAETDTEDHNELVLPVELLIPTGWRLSKKGIFSTGERGSQNVCSEPIIITKKQYCVDTGILKFTLSWLVGNTWKEVTVPGSVAFDARKLVSLADYGFPASSENCRPLAKWLKDLESANKGLETTQAVAQLGWTDEGKFAPTDDDVVVDMAEGLDKYIKGFKSVGTFDEWKLHAMEIRKHTIPRIAMAASFAAPLLSLLGSRNFLTYMWGPTKGGKSAALVAAASIWGCPETLPLTFNSTMTAIERVCTLYNDLPTFIDERQAAGNRQDFINNLVYMVGAGKSRGRGTKTGLQVQKNWHGLVIATGEEPLCADNSTGGMETRCLELCGKPFPNETVARNVYEWTSQNYGHAGRVFIEAVKQTPQGGLQRIIADARKHINDRATELLLKARAEDSAAGRGNPGEDEAAVITLSGSHVEFAAVLIVADALAGEFVFGLPEDEAGEEALRLADEIIGILKPANGLTDAARAQDFIESWIATTFSASDGLHGEEVNGGIWIVAESLDKALADNKFSPKKIRAELRETGYFETFEDNGRPVATWKRKYHGGRPPMYHVIREERRRQAQ